MREENNLDSDYQPSLMQEGENISIATKTTSQCHVTTVEAASVQETDCTSLLFLAGGGPIHDSEACVNQIHTSHSQETNWPYFPNSKSFLRDHRETHSDLTKRVKKMSELIFMNIECCDLP